MSQNTTGNQDQASARTGFAVGMAWNLASLAFLAFAGIALNIVIGRWYGPEALGTFNIAFAMFIFLSQIASFGLQFSALHAVSTVSSVDTSRLHALIYGGLLVCAVIAGLVTVMALLLTPVLTKVFPAVPDLGRAWLYVAPGLLPFALNKYLLGVLNGLQHMRAFSVMQAMRFVLILAMLAGMIVLGAPGYALVAVLSMSEFLLLLMLGSYVLRLVPLQGDWSTAMQEGKEHARFGLKVFPAGMVAELNTRVDVLMLGALINDKVAGIYTIAALIYEAALQAVVVVRNSINPRLAQDMANGNHAKILQESRWLALGFTAAMAAGAMVAWFGFPTAAGLLFPGKDFMTARDPLFWLMLALPVSGAALCYSLILSQAGRPGWQSIAMLITLAVNVTANAVLIPLYGMTGAAIAMGLSGITMGWVMVFLARRILGVRLFF